MGRCLKFAFDTLRTKKKKRKDKFHLQAKSGDVVPRCNPWGFSSHMTTNIASWQLPFTAPYDIQELKDLGWHVIRCESLTFLNDVCSLTPNCSIIKLDDKTRRKLSRNDIEVMMRDKNDFMTQSREHTGGKMFCSGINKSGTPYQGTSAASQTADVALTLAIEDFLASHQVLHEMIPSHEHLHTDRGAKMLQSERFSKLCGSLTMMNLEHTDDSDTGLGVIIWRQFRYKSDLQAYFLLEIPAEEEGTPSTFIALEIIDGLGIVLDTTRVKHRSILVGPMMQSLMRPYRDLTVTSDTHPCTYFSKSDVDHMARCYWEREGKGIIGLAWIQSVNKCDV